MLPRHYPSPTSPQHSNVLPLCICSNKHRQVSFSSWNCARFSLMSFTLSSVVSPCPVGSSRGCVQITATTAFAGCLVPQESSGFVTGLNSVCLAHSSAQGVFSRKKHCPENGQLPDIFKACPSDILSQVIFSFSLKHEALFKALC